jgi:hypothetical protein
MKQELPQNETKRRNQMETNKKNEQAQNAQQKLIFLNFDRFFWSKDFTKLFLVLPGGITVPVHVNFMKARLGLEYTPAPRKTKPEAAPEAQVA